MYGVYGGHNLYIRQKCVICFGIIAYVPRHGDYMYLRFGVCPVSESPETIRNIPQSERPKRV